uniref:PE-PGRS family protein n=1 Tax=Parastrongyloides trichosuri TaxID=131310 RepID=A0A0N4ZZC5_PARTI
MEGLAQRRVDVDGSGHVLQHGAHFQHLGEAVGQLRDMLADGLNAQQTVIRLGGDDADEAAVLARFDGQGAADGGEGEDSLDHVVAALDVVGAEAGRDDFRLGEADGGDGGRVEHAIMTGDDFGHDFTLRRALVRQHGFAGQVADGPDVLHAGGAAIVDLHERAVHGHAHVLQAPALGPRAAADGDQHLVGIQLHRVSVLVGDVQLAVAEPSRAGAEQQLHAVFLQPLGDGVGQGLVVERQDAIGHLDDGDFGAQLAEGDAQLQADIAAADDDELLRDLGQAQGLGGGDHVAAERQEGQFDRLRPRGQNDVLGGNADIAVVGFHGAGLGVRKLGPALDDLDLGLLQQGGDARVQLLDHAVLPLDRLRQVDGRGRGGDAQGSVAGGLGHRLILARCVDDGLGRNAADVQAGAAEARRGVHQHGLQPQLAATDPRHIAAGSGADDQDFGLEGLHQTLRSSPRRRGPRFRLRAQRLGQIAPARVHVFNQPQLPLTVPLLDLPLPLKRRLAGFVDLEPDQSFDLIAGCELGARPFLVLPGPQTDVVRRARVERPIPSAGHDVGEEGQGRGPKLKPGSPPPRG